MTPQDHHPIISSLSTYSRIIYSNYPIWNILNSIWKTQTQTNLCLSIQQQEVNHLLTLLYHLASWAHLWFLLASILWMGIWENAILTFLKTNLKNLAFWPNLRCWIWLEWGSHQQVLHQNFIGWIDFFFFCVLEMTLPSSISSLTKLSDLSISDMILQDGDRSLNVCFLKEFSFHFPILY